MVSLLGQVKGAQALFSQWEGTGFPSVSKSFPFPVHLLHIAKYLLHNRGRTVCLCRVPCDMLRAMLGQARCMGQAVAGSSWEGWESFR